MPTTLFDYGSLDPDFWTILPELIVTVFAIVVIFVDLFTKGDQQEPVICPA